MNNETFINHLQSLDNLYYYQYNSLIGNIYIISDDQSLKAIMLNESTFGPLKINKLKNNPSTQINKTIIFFNEYFKTSKNKKLISYLSLLKKNKNHSPHYTISFYSNRIKNKTSINVDLNIFTNIELSIIEKLISLPFGSILSYKKLSEKSGIKNGARFVGNVMAKNPFPILIPCHRIIKSDGSIGNYSGGINIKKTLLHHENSLIKT